MDAIKGPCTVFLANPATSFIAKTALEQDSYAVSGRTPDGDGREIHEEGNKPETAKCLAVIYFSFVQNFARIDFQEIKVMSRGQTVNIIRN